MVEIVNRQKSKRINLKELKKHLGKIFVLLDISGRQLSILLCDNKCITRLNRTFFKRNAPTDVIAFPLQDKFDRDYLGEVVVSVQQASLAAKNYGNTWRQELLLYIIHGILHLLGYKDNTKKQRARMERKQNEILAKLLQATGYKLQATGSKV